MNAARTQTNEVTLQAEAGTDQYLTFMLAGEEYGVDILRVQEIKGWDSVTPIPNTPDHILGVINLRGTVVPIIDLRNRFGLEAIQFGSTTVVIVMKVASNEHERTMGIVVDAVSDVYNVAGESIKAAPEFGGAANTDFVKGLATVDEKMVILLETDDLLNPDMTEYEEGQARQT